MEITYGDRTVNSWFDASTANEIKTVVNANEIKKVTATLSSEEILAGTVKEILASPGSGKYIKLISADLIYKHGGVDYVGAYYIILDYVNTLSGKTYVSSFDLASSSSGHSNLIDMAIFTTGYTGASGYVIENKGLYIGLEDTPTTGNGTLKIDILYTIEDY
jgi:hypothetical protein